MSARNKLESLQLLRFVAASFVILFHANNRVERSFPDQYYDRVVLSFAQFDIWGNFGIDLFFVISGFIMLLVSEGNFQKKNAVKDFMIKRIIRIVPIYYFLTTVAVLLLIFSPDLFSYRETVDIPWIIASYLFIPMASSDGFVAPVLGLGWTLNYEMYFYCIFSLTLFMNKKNAARFISIFFITSIALGRIFNFTSPFLSQITNWMLLDFLFGIWIAKLYLDNKVNKKIIHLTGVIGVLVLLSTIFSYPHEGLTQVLYWGLPSAAIIISCVSLSWESGPLGKVLVKLGDASYSIYLIHAFTLPAFAILFRLLKLHNYIQIDVLIVMITILSIISGYIFYHIAEKPMTLILRNYIKGRRYCKKPINTVKANLAIERFNIVRDSSELTTS